MYRQTKQIDIDYEKILKTADKLGLTDGELRMFIAIVARINSDGFCETSNETFMRKFFKSERTITSWISSLEDRNIIRTIFNNHKHKRHIYIRMPGLVKTPYQPITNPNFMTDEQYKFHQILPDRDIDCEWDPALNMDAVISEIKKSYFLRNNNMSLASFKRNYNKIISGAYRDQGWIGTNAKPNFSCRRNYTKEEINSVIQDIDDIEI